MTLCHGGFSHSLFDIMKLAIPYLSGDLEDKSIFMLAMYTPLCYLFQSTFSSLYFLIEMSFQIYWILFPVEP